MPRQSDAGNDTGCGSCTILRGSLRRALEAACSCEARGAALARELMIASCRLRRDCQLLDRRMYCAVLRTRMEIDAFCTRKQSWCRRYVYMMGGSRLGDHELQTTERLRMTGSAHALRRATMTDFASRDGDVPSHAISARIRAGHAVGPALLAGGLCNGAMHSLAWRECIAANTARSARLLTGHDARWTRGAAPKTQLFGWLQKRTQILLFPCDESDQKCEIVSDRPSPRRESARYTISPGAT